MKTLITITIILSVVVSSCEVPASIEREKKIKAFLYDGCQYLQISQYYDDSGPAEITHKGNCNNPIHFKHTDK